ncbi:MAG: hypothetical protein OXC92_08190 [Flavobacteriaceae bacterium]|nr:hypothetical protein [Flavobacteriaceae bacterium]MCY4216943.1 hypothetical protein [Flavobacteriaceae bacterium]MCY4253530.1 hypothetical protein [Flavobacteriaceae bacterium]
MTKVPKMHDAISLYSEDMSDDLNTDERGKANEFNRSNEVKYGTV